jgi:pimeloyl-ACP methyl ester carboxylesterase
MKLRLDSVPGIRHVVLPGGHHLHLDDPAPTAHALVTFLREVGLVQHAS